MRTAATASPSRYQRTLRIIFAFYLALLVWLVLLKGFKVLDNEGVRLRVADSTHAGKVNLIPGKTILYYFSNQEPLFNTFFNVGGNLAVFMPLGLLLPASYKRFRRFYRTLGAAFFLSTFFEFSQYITRSGSPDVDDVVLNTAGAAFGYLLFRLLMQKPAPAKTPMQ